LLSKCYNWQRKSKRLSYRRDISIITTSLDDIIKQHKELQNDWYGNTEETTSTDETIDSWEYNEANELNGAQGTLLEGDIDYVNSFKTLDSRDSIYYLENPLNFVCSITSHINTVDIENPALDSSYDIDNNSESDDSHSRNTNAWNGQSEDSKFYYSTDVFNSKFSRCEDSDIALV
jgi:hypothetical protein